MIFCFTALLMVFTYGNCSIADNVPGEYLEGIRAIHIYDTDREMGFYFWNGVIKIFQCDEDILIHELAHHKNKMDGYSFRESAKHSAVFLGAYSQIRGDYYEHQRDR